MKTLKLSFLVIALLFISSNSYSSPGWFPQNSSVNKTFFDVYFINELTGWAVGYLSRILKTTNGGDNWFVQPRITSRTLYSVFFTNSNTGWVVGEYGTILKTTNGGTVFVNKIENIIPKIFSLSQNYPNPFNPTTTIRYDIKTKGNIELKVFDLLGREITMLVNESQTPGTYEIVFDAASLPSGVYFYQLKAGDFVETKKMVVVK
ncbi:MAG: T9SS type A sorting domain-containing protein [Ignavibacteria bacterium]|nr:T9SS type A sorting domain-containing protein [Ignavibacteria bacterium]